MKTNFAALTTEQKTVWSRDLWKVARNNSFINQFMGGGSNAMCQRITELSESEKGARAVITLVPDLVGDGISGDNTLEGNEEQIKAYDRVIRIDQLRHANRTTGKMADQRSIINFRENSRDQLAYWMSDRLDQLAIQTLAGVPLSKTPKYVARTDSTFASLDFAADVTPPSADRYFNWSGTALTAGDATAAMGPVSWAMLVELRAQMKTKYIKGVRGAGGIEVYHVFLDPLSMAKLKLDSDYLAAARSALPRAKSQELWAGTDSLVIDGMMIHEHRHVPSFAASAAVDETAGEATAGEAGTRAIVCGAQALAMADLGDPEWNEKKFDYDNQLGVSTGKILGFLKPKFASATAGADEDFGVLVCNVGLA